MTDGKAAVVWTEQVGCLVAYSPRYPHTQHESTFFGFKLCCWSRRSLFCASYSCSNFPCPCAGGCDAPGSCEGVRREELVKNCYKNRHEGSKTGVRLPSSSTSFGSLARMRGHARHITPMDEYARIKSIKFASWSAVSPEMDQLSSH